MARTIGPVTATSANWKVITRAWRTTRAPILISLSCRLVNDQLGHGLWQLDAAQEGGQIVGQRVLLQPHLVVAELPAG